MGASGAICALSESFNANKLCSKSFNVTSEQLTAVCCTGNRNILSPVLKMDNSCYHTIFAMKFLESFTE